MAKINELKFQLLPHSSYSPNLDPSDYFLFLNLKKWFASQKFANNKEVKSVTNGYFEVFDDSSYKQGIEAIEQHWEKFIELQEDYLEK